MAYSEKVLDHYENPRNVGSFGKDDGAVGTGMVGAPACGDVMKLQIRVGADGIIQDAKFKTYGCGSAIASSSLVTEWVKGKTLELEVRAVREPPAKAPEGAKVADEYLQSNYFINSANARVKELAEEAVGKETDPWKKAKRIERWVKNNMKVQNFTEAMATADHVAKTLEGDCTEHAMLAAAMCRAAGVPSKVAVGLVYVDQAKGAVLGFHMWTEVWVRGEWVPIDATLGQGGIGAAHLKISDHSWHDTQSLKPLLPIMRVMLAKPAIEVVRVGEPE